MSNPGEDHNHTRFAEVMVMRPQLYNASQLLEEEKNTNPSFFDEGAYPNPCSTEVPWILSRSPLDANIDNLSLHELTLYLIHVFREADSGWKNETGEVPEIFRRTISTFEKILPEGAPVLNSRYKTVVDLYNILSLMQFIYMSFTPFDTQQHSCYRKLTRFAKRIHNISLYYLPLFKNKKFTELIIRRSIVLQDIVSFFTRIFSTITDTVDRLETAFWNLPRGGSYCCPHFYSCFFII